MFRVGIIGSDNSHALAFSKLTNIKNELTGEYEFPDIRVTAIYGHDEKRTEEVAREGRIEFIAKDPKEMFSSNNAI